MKNPVPSQHTTVISALHSSGTLFPPKCHQEIKEEQMKVAHATFLCPQLLLFSLFCSPDCSSAGQNEQSAVIIPVTAPHNEIFIQCLQPSLAEGCLAVSKLRTALWLLSASAAWVSGWDPNNQTSFSSKVDSFFFKGEKIYSHPLPYILSDLCPHHSSSSFRVSLQFFPPSIDCY